MVVPLIINALTQRRISGGGFAADTPVAPANCPVPGSGVGQLVFHADQVFASGFGAVLSELTDQSGDPSATSLFGPVDGAFWAWSGGEGVSGVGFTAPSCPGLTVTGGIVEAWYGPATGNVNVAVVVHDSTLTDVVDASEVGATGPGMLALPLTATQAAGLISGAYSTALISDPHASAAVEWDAIRWTIDYVA